MTRIHAVIRGVGVSVDGRSASLVNPETSGQVLAVRRAWAAAGLDPAAPDALGLLKHMAQRPQPVTPWSLPR